MDVFANDQILNDASPAGAHSSLLPKPLDHKPRGTTPHACLHSKAP